VYLYVKHVTTQVRCLWGLSDGDSRKAQPHMPRIGGFNVDAETDPLTTRASSRNSTPPYSPSILSPSTATVFPNYSNGTRSWYFLPRSRGCDVTELSRRNLGGVPHHNPRAAHAALFGPQGRADSLRSKACHTVILPSG